jgi:hypothetical protein
VTRLDKLEGEELSSQSSEAKRTPSGDPSGAQQGKHPQEALRPPLQRSWMIRGLGPRIRGQLQVLTMIEMPNCSGIYRSLNAFIQN